MDQRLRRHRRHRGLRVGRRHEQRPRGPAEHEHWRSRRVPAAARDEHPARQRGQPDEPADVLGGQQPRSVPRQSGAAAMIRTVAALVLFLVLPSAGQAQEWIEYTDRAERFTVNFPGKPVVSDSTWESQRDDDLPARVYTARAGEQRYTLTVVNLATIAQSSDVKGSIAWAAWQFRKRGGEITYDAYAQSDRIEGHELHITNRDRTTTLAGIYMLARRLYILDATVPPNSPGAVHFLQSLLVLDEKGDRIR